jgi:hypothetical protein
MSLSASKASSRGERLFSRWSCLVSRALTVKDLISGRRRRSRKLSADLPPKQPNTPSRNWTRRELRPVIILNKDSQPPKRQ